MTVVARGAKGGGEDAVPGQLTERDIRHQTWKRREGRQIGHQSTMAEATGEDEGLDQGKLARGMMLSA